MPLRVLVIVGLTLLSLGCHLFDDPDGVVLTNADADRIVDMGNVPDAAAPDMSINDMGPQDVSMVDQGTADGGFADADMADMPEPLDIDPFTLLALIRNEVCEYYTRQNYHGTVFFGVGFRTQAGCEEFFDLFLRNVLGVLARDAHFDRARINEDAVRAIIDHVQNYNGDPRVFPITDVGSIVTPLSGIGGPCSSAFACVSSPSRPAQCYLQNPEDCDGECVDSRRVCAGGLCAEDEWCFQNACVQFVPDGGACTNDAMCANRCLTNVCGTLDIGDDCTANPGDCGPGAFCRSDLAPRICAPLGILNDPCVDDSGCDVGHFCDEATSLCATIAEGTPCRLSACISGLNCVQTSDVDSALRCFAPRPAGQYCDTDEHCSIGTYCNVNTCTAAKTLGAPCRNDRECESICRYPDTDAMTGTCAQFDWGLDNNQTCHVEAELCGMPFECETLGGNTLSGVCRPPAPIAIGEACEPSRPFWCPDGSTCRGGVCEPILADGASCTANDQCESSLCVMGSCFDRVDACTAGLMP